MTGDDPGADQMLFWGRGVLGPRCAHLRETYDGRPVVEEVCGESDARVGFALCGCLLIADTDPDGDGVTRCSVCIDRFAKRAADRPPG